MATLKRKITVSIVIACLIWLLLEAWYWILNFFGEM